MSSATRRNIYKDADLKMVGEQLPVIGVVLGSLFCVILFVLALYLMYYCFLRDTSPSEEDQSKAQEPLIDETRGNSTHDGNSMNYVNLWKRAFNHLLSDNYAGGRRMEILQSVLHVPFDMKLDDPLVNTDLFSDKISYEIAKERRRNLSDVLCASTEM